MFRLFNRAMKKGIEEGVKEGLDESLPQLMKKVVRESMEAVLETSAKGFEGANPETKFTGVQVAQMLRKIATGLVDVPIKS